MKLVKKVETIALNEDVKVGSYYEMEDTLSCSKTIVRLADITTNGIKTIRLSDGKVQEITYKQLEKYEVKKMKLVYDDNSSILSQAAKVKSKQDRSKEECERATEEYRKQVESAIKDMLGDNVGVRFVG